MMIIDHPWYFVMLCLLAGAAYAGILYHVGRNRFPRGLRWGLTALRFVAVSAIAFLLLAPLTKQDVTERQLPKVILAQDVSQSVALCADSSFTMDALAQTLDGHCQVTLETFGNNGCTDIGAVLEKHRNDNVAALVLASDGIHNRGINPTTVAERLSFPIHCIALGDTTPQHDADLRELRCNRIAMLNNQFPVEVTVKTTLLDGQSSTLTISDAEGRQMLSLPVHYEGRDFSTLLSFSLTATKPGLQRYTLHLKPVDGESNLNNNTLVFYVDVVDTRQRIAIYANAPHPDLAALKQALENNPNYEASVIMADDARHKKDSNYSLAILHNLPSQRHSSIAFADGVPKLYIIGLQTDLARFNALHSGLEIVARSSRTNELTAIHQPSFPLFSLDPDDAAAIESLPPLSAPFGEAKTTPDVQTLFNARLGNIDTRQPLIAASSQGEQRRTFLWGEGIWRWRLADYQAHQSHQHVDRLITQLVAFTALQTNRDRLQITTERTYSTGEAVTLRAELYNESYQLNNGPDINLHLTGDSLQADYIFRRTGQSYTLTLPELKAGLYQYHASTADGLTSDGSFAVEELNTERQCLVADHSMLRTLATLTGGQLFSPQELSTLNSLLLKLKPTLYTHTRYAELLRMPWVLILIILLLAAEWILRKYHGEI